MLGCSIVTMVVGGSGDDDDDVINDDDLYILPKEAFSMPYSMLSINLCFFVVEF